MLSKVYSAAIHGLNAYVVSVQVDESNGLPRSMTLGNVSASVKEAIERVSIALKNLGMELPPKKITINLQPADLRKNGSSFDLPIFMGTLLALYPSCDFPYENYGFLGELGLDGEIRPVAGVLPMVLALEEAGMEGVFVSKDNEQEARNSERLKVISCSHITELLDICKIPYGKKEERKNIGAGPSVGRNDESYANGNEEDQNLDFQDVLGQSYGVRAALIAAAGHHALLFSGPAGTGKTMIAKRIPGILPKMSKQEKLELTKIYSIASCLPSEKGLIEKRPFRAPHSAVSQNTLLGGMSSGRLIPGELALAGKGVLFLDELPLFKRAYGGKKSYLTSPATILFLSGGLSFCGGDEPLSLRIFSGSKSMSLYAGTDSSISTGDFQTDSGKNGFMRILAVDYFAGCIDQGERNFFGGFKKTGGKGKENAGKTLLSRREDTMEWRYECYGSK